MGRLSDDERIVYRPAEGATVVITGSEIIDAWEPVDGDVWKATIDGGFFEGCNPYDDRIRGDWVDDKGRSHHTGAVYLNGRSLIEATTREAVFDAESGHFAWYGSVAGGTIAFTTT